MNEQDPVYRDFVRTAVLTQTVYTLQDGQDFFAECPSENYRDDFGEATPVYCFWHHADTARACQQDEWETYELIAISLSDFMYEILIEMDQQEQLVGVSFDAELYGSEVEPVELLGDLLDEIQRRNMIDDFPDFDELQRYRLEWEQMLRQNQIIH